MAFAVAMITLMLGSLTPLLAEGVSRGNLQGCGTAEIQMAQSSPLHLSRIRRGRPSSRPPQTETNQPHQFLKPSVAQNENHQTNNARPTGHPIPEQPNQPFATVAASAPTVTVDGVPCGRTEVQPSPLISYGQKTVRGEWPWHAAIYQAKGNGISYSCGGSIIGKQTILTAAHCVTWRNQQKSMDPDKLLIFLGMHLLKLWSEEDVQVKKVREIKVHPEYNSSSLEADIAVVILSSPAQFTSYVKPICLWDRSRPQLSEVADRSGVVVGWGYDENDKLTEEMMMATLPVVSQETCLRSYPEFYGRFTSARTYCAGYRNGTSVCNGDSGAGMFFPVTGGGEIRKPITWTLRGIVSLSPPRIDRNVCDTKNFVVFTDVVKYYDWLDEYYKLA